jgi:hypothetical protein
MLLSPARAGSRPLRGASLRDAAALHDHDSVGQRHGVLPVAGGVFRGPRRSFTVETADPSSNVDCASTRAASVGDTVTLLVDADNAWALKA